MFLRSAVRLLPPLALLTASVVFGVLFRGHPLSAQISEATVSGTVNDPTGAVVAGASVEIRNVSTNVATTTTTNGSGVYVFPSLIVGSYSVTVTASGFKSSVRGGIELHVADRVQLNFALELGSTSEQITVNSNSELIETNTASRGQVINHRDLVSLPIPSRNVFMLATLTTGVYNANNRPTYSGRPQDGTAAFSSINGGQGSNYEILLDGVPNISQERGPSPYVNLVPSPEAVEEFKVQTNVYDAQYGRSGGGVLNLVLKSGTNRIHGSLYEHWGNDILNASRFEDNRNGLRKSVLRLHQPGVELDGPVFIPKVYDGRNRTFFMYSWEGQRNSTPIPQVNTVPTASQRAGNFSSTVQADGSRITVYDPLTTTLMNGAYIRQPFAGNIIPANRIDPIANRLASYIPAANTAANAAGFFNFVVSPNSDVEAYDQHIVRIDQALTDKQRFFGSFTRNLNHEYTPDYGFPLAASPSFVHWRGNQGAHIDWTSIFSPTLVLDSRLGFMRHSFAIQAHGEGFDLRELGFSNNVVSQLPHAAFPGVDIAEYIGFGYSSSQYSETDNYSLSETMTKLSGAHSLKFGGELRVSRSNQQLPTSSSGDYSFNRGFTQRDALRGDAASGNSYASFLLGYPAGGNVAFNIAAAYANRYHVLFLHDDWRVNRRLTLNLGVRWDYESPVVERFNRQNRGFDTTAASPLQVPGLNLKGGLLFTGDRNREPYKRNLANFQPRIGAAYKLRKTLVLRAGYGLTYAPVLDNGYNNGFSITTPYVSTSDGGLTPARQLTNPYPDGILRPTGSSLGLSTFLGNSFTYGYFDRTIPKTHQFSIGLQQALPWRMVIDASYVGSRYIDLRTSQNINAIPAGKLALGNALLTPVPNPFQGKMPGTPYNDATIPAQQLLRPFPQFGDITQASRSIGKTWYDSLQVRLEKRLSAGLQLQLSYTYGKAIQAVGYLNSQDPIGQLARVIAPDPPHRVAIASTYALPFFRQAHPVVKQIAGGWQINTIIAVQSGRLIGAPAAAYSTGIAPELPEGQQNLNRWFNTCTLTTAGVRQRCASADEPVAWLVQPAFTLRTLSTRFPHLRTSVPPNVDLSLFKNFFIREPLKLQFQASAYNISNTPEFGTPNTGINSANFGVVTPSQVNDARIIRLSLKLTF